MFIQQISVFLENKQGALREMTSILGASNVSIRGISIADTQSFGVVRMILDSADTQRTVDMLDGAGYTVKLNHVICAAVDDCAGGLNHLLAVIDKEQLSVEYLYSLAKNKAGKALIVLRLSEQETAVKTLEAYGVKIIEQEEADSI